MCHTRSKLIFRKLSQFHQISWVVSRLSRKLTQPWAARRPSTLPLDGSPHQPSRVTHCSCEVCVRGEARTLEVTGDLFP